MLTVYEIEEKLGRNWWMRTEDIVSGLEDLGFEVIECSLEWVSFYDPAESDGLQYTIYLRGVNNITIDRLETDRV